MEVKKENKLTIDQMKNYLGTGLILDVEDEVASEEMNFLGVHQSTWAGDVVSFGGKNGVDMRCIDQIKPVCYRLSDLDKYIEELGFVPIEELLKIATEMIWSERIDPIGKSEILTEGDSTGIIAWNDTERVSFTLDKQDNWFDFALYVDGSEMKLDKFHLFQKLFQWHFWPFGEEDFEAGLVIDKLKLQPSKDSTRKEASNG